jgi:DNA-binding transcriptional ArsR family regulator
MDIEELAPRAGEAAELLALMANEKRLLILCHLLDQELSVNELAERVDLAQSPLSQHLMRLRAMKLVSTRRNGQMILYRLASESVAKLLATLHGIYCAPARSVGGAKRKNDG